MNRLLGPGRLMACFLLVFSVLFFTACSALVPKQGTLPVFVIFHTNDIHGYAAPERDENGQLTRVGYALLKGRVNQSTTAVQTFLVDAGDMLHGQPLATARRGEAMARIISAVGYDALAVGNHEFDYGLDRLLELRRKYSLPFVAANVRYKDSGRLVFPPYIVKKVPAVRLMLASSVPDYYTSVKVGFFGLSSPGTPGSTNPANVAALSFSDGEAMAQDAREIIRTLKEDEKVDMVVALTHLGTESYVQYNAQWLAQEAPGIDLIIDGHSHSEVQNLIVAETVIVSTGAFFRNIGVVEVPMPIERYPLWKWDSGYLESAAKLEERVPQRCTLGGVLPWVGEYVTAADPKIAALLEKTQKELAEEMAAVVGQTPFELEGRREIVRHGGTNLGRLITAAMVKYTGADAAIFNSGSIRASIPAGEITRGKLLEVLPFGNYAVTVKISGAELRQVMQQGLARPGDGGFLQFSGVSVTKRGNSIRSITIGGQPLSDKAEYTVAINDFMNDGGDGYDLLKKRPAGEYETVEEMLLKYLRGTPAAPLR